MKVHLAEARNEYTKEESLILWRKDIVNHVPKYFKHLLFAHLRSQLP